MDINQATAKAIASERAISGLTVRELSSKAGIPQSTLMRILGAEREIKIGQIERLAAAFGVYPHEIVEQAEVIMGRAARDASSIRPLKAVTSDGFTLAARDVDDDDEAEAQQHDA